MRILIGTGLALILAGAVAAQTVAEIPLTDPRLGISTLVREDLFAGYLANDKTRFARGEETLDKLLTLRPNNRADILAWQGGDKIYEAVSAWEAGRAADYARLYRQGMDLLAEAKRLDRGDSGAAAVTGGVMMLFADRLAPDDRAAAWTVAYDSFQALKKAQPRPEVLPLHFRGELMAGLVESSQRTGHTDEMAEALDHMLVLTKGTPYEAAAQQWKDNPTVAATSSLGCKSCHDAGRLAPSLARLAPKAG